MLVKYAGTAVGLLENKLLLVHCLTGWLRLWLHSVVVWWGEKMPDIFTN
jgi:hypothetical protein